jgi:hypothetical protein
MSKQTNQLHQSFLVRCWLIPQGTVGEPSLWRFELQELTAESQKHRFSDLEQLNAFMAARLTAVADSSKQDDGKEEN